MSRRPPGAEDDLVVSDEPLPPPPPEIGPPKVRTGLKLREKTRDHSRDLPPAAAPAPLPAPEAATPRAPTPPTPSSRAPSAMSPPAPSRSSPLAASAHDPARTQKLVIAASAAVVLATVVGLIATRNDAPAKVQLATHADAPLAPGVIDPRIVAAKAATFAPVPPGGRPISYSFGPVVQIPRPKPMPASRGRTRVRNLSGVKWREVTEYEPTPMPKRDGYDATEAPAPSNPKLLVVSEPPGAFVEVDGKLVGVTPLFTPAEDDWKSIKVRVMKPGFMEQSQTISANKKGDFEAVVDLAKKIEAPASADPNAPRKS